MESEKRSNYLLLLGIGIYAFLLIQQSLNSLLIPDEFQVAKTLSLFRDGLTPYIDFKPYKNVLGYYSLSPFLSLFDGVLSSIIGMRLIISFIFSLCFSFLIFELKKHFKLSSLLYSLLFFSSLYFIIGNLAVLRIDTLSSALLCLIIAYLFKKKNKTACFLIAISFLVSQKAAFYVFSIFPAYLILNFNNKKLLDKESLKEIFRISFIMLLPLIIYYSFWMAIGNSSLIYQSNVKEAIEMGFKDEFLSITKIVWANTFFNHPLVMFLIYFSMASSFLNFNKIPKNNRLAIVFSSLVILNLCFYKSVWPYTFVNFFPAALPLLCWFIDLYQEKVSKRVLIIASITSLLILIPKIHKLQSALTPINTTQSQEILLAEAIAKNEYSYISSFNLLFNNKHALPHSWIDGTFRTASNQWSKKQIKEFIEKTKKNNPAVLIYDRLLETNLQPEVLDYLEANFTHFQKSIYTRSIKFSPRNQKIEVELEGVYQLYSSNSSPVEIDKKKVGNFELIILKKGVYTVKAGANSHLQWIPDIPEDLLIANGKEKTMFNVSIFE